MITESPYLQDVRITDVRVVTVPSRSKGARRGYWRSVHLVRSGLTDAGGGRAVDERTRHSLTCVEGVSPENSRNRTASKAAAASCSQTAGLGALNETT